MEQRHTTQLLLVFRLALGLKLVGILLGAVVAYQVTGDWLWQRWGISLLDTAVLLLLLLPWENWWPGWGAVAALPGAAPALAVSRYRLPLTLALALIFPQIEYIYVVRLPLPTLDLPLIAGQNGSLAQLSMLQSEAVLFMLLPVVLASWQYGRNGMIASLVLAILLHLVAAFFLAPVAFSWVGYTLVSGIRLGLLLVVGFTVQVLVTAQRREHAALQVAHRQLAARSATMEQLAISQERNRLARELHDTLAHTLSGTAVQLQAISTLLKIDPDAAATELNAARQQVRLGLVEARRAIATLRAMPLEELGLAEALRQQLHQLGERAGISIQYHIETPLPSAMPHCTPLHEQTIYRIAAEALINAEKYAQAGNLRLALQRQGDGLLLTIADDGVGFAATEVEKEGGFGLYVMRERANLIAATLTIDSAPGAGTRLTLFVPGVWPGE